VYICEGTATEKIEWFKIINIAGEILTDQEIRNAVYTGSWLTEAKRYFSKKNCQAINIGEKYIQCLNVDRQLLLEKVLYWISDGNVTKYMSEHQFDKDCDPLIQYYKKIISWVEILFPEHKNKDMRKVNWGDLYNKYKDNSYNSKDLNEKYESLLQDETLDLKNTTGIYYYLITNDEKYLNVRLFNERQKRATYTKQNGICVKCKNKFEYEEMAGDHIIPWSKGGKTIQDNCQMLCKTCNGRKSNT
jgi:hypothetical protein